MKLSYRNYPILALFDKKYCETVTLMNNPEADSNTEVLKYANKCIQGGYLCDMPIYYVSKEFNDALNKNALKLRDVVRKDIELIKELYEPGVVFFPEGEAMIYCRNEDGSRQIFMIANKEGRVNDVFIGSWSNRKYLLQDEESHTCTNRRMLRYCLLMAFKRFATVELEIIEPHKKTKSNIDKQGKVINDTGVEVTMLDSRWFREIIRNEGFKVRGHFRLQPYKNEHGEWTRKFIYIEEFEKHGYHRRAKMSVENDFKKQNQNE